MVHGLKNPKAAGLVNTWATVTDMVAASPNRLAPDPHLAEQAHTRLKACNHMGS